MNPAVILGLVELITKFNPDKNDNEVDPRALDKLNEVVREFQKGIERLEQLEQTIQELQKLERAVRELRRIVDRYEPGE